MVTGRVGEEMESSQPIIYRLAVEDPVAHLWRVECQIETPDSSGQRIALPRWIPGSYTLRDYARQLVSINAWSAEGPVAMVKYDQQGWQAAPCSGWLTISYQIYAFDLSVRGSHLDSSHGYLNGPALFVRVEGAESRPCQLELLENQYTRGWRVATTLPGDGAPDWGFGRYRAANYHELIDHPIEMGSWQRADFEVAGVPHHLIVTGRHHGDLERLADDLEAICSRQVELFGELPVQRRYLFLLQLVDDGYGGLEHRDCCSLIASRRDLPPAGRTGVDEAYRTLLGLCSHEYFHLWNVKRIRPAAVVASALEREAETRDLWVYEGITAYYDDLMLLRSNRIDTASYLELLGQSFCRFSRQPGRMRQTLAEASFDTWTRFYRQDEGSPNHLVSYYSKGAAVALLLDLQLRLRGQSLDQLMRRLWQLHGDRGSGMAEGEIEQIASQLAGESLANFFDSVLRSVEPLPLEHELSSFAIQLNHRSAEGGDDRGGRPPGTPRPSVSIGARLRGADGGTRIESVLNGQSAWRADINAGDLVIAVDSIRCGERLQNHLDYHGYGASVTLHLFRRDELIERRLELQPPPAETIWLTLATEADETAVERRRAWLGEERLADR